MEGRETGSAGRKAGEYLINHYTKEGVTYPKEQQTFIKRRLCRILNKGRS
jgi:hypothetical protein